MVIANPVVIAETEILIEPLLAPPVPAKARPIPCPPEVPPYLPLDPLLDVGEITARMSYPEVAVDANT
jgi:hypothetical protein